MVKVVLFIRFLSVQNDTMTHWLHFHLNNLNKNQLSSDNFLVYNY